jgi:hypothetical protein
VLSNGGPQDLFLMGLMVLFPDGIPTAGNFALVAKNNAGSAVYTGLAIAQDNGQNYLYAANFATGKYRCF